jgi:hypothetical protein
MPVRLCAERSGQGRGRLTRLPSKPRISAALKIARATVAALLTASDSDRTDNDLTLTKQFCNRAILIITGYGDFWQ